MVRLDPKPPDDGAQNLLQRAIGATMSCLDRGPGSQGWCGTFMHIVSLRFIRGRSRRSELFHAIDEWIDDTAEGQDISSEGQDDTNIGPNTK